MNTRTTTKIDKSKVDNSEADMASRAINKLKIKGKSFQPHKPSYLIDLTKGRNL